MSPALPSMMTRLLVLLSVIAVAATQTAIPRSGIKVKAKNCENDGIWDGVKCLCLGFTMGTKCQNIIDRLEIGKEFNATIKVVLTVDYNYTDDLNNESSNNYIDFAKKYDEMMQEFFKRPKEGYVIKNLQKDNEKVKVENEVFITLDYNDTRTVLMQYEEKYQEVKNALNHSCVLHTLCQKVDSNDPIRPLTEIERCAQKITAQFMHLFDSVVSVDGLACVSICEPASPNYLNCNRGSCQIRGEEGPQCFCPDTDTYLYTYPKCKGAVSIAALYGGVGASIGLLVIVGVVLGVFLYRKKYYY